MDENTHACTSTKVLRGLGDECHASCIADGGGLLLGCGMASAVKHEEWRTPGGLFAFQLGFYCQSVVGEICTDCS